MVGAPGPDVVEHDVVAVHDKADRRLAGSRAANSENTSESVVGLAGLLLWECGVPTRSKTGEFTGPASNISPDSLTPGTSQPTSR